MNDHVYCFCFVSSNSVTQLAIIKNFTQELTINYEYNLICIQASKLCMTKKVYHKVPANLS